MRGTRYPEEFKIQAVTQVTEGGNKIKDAAVYFAGESKKSSRSSNHESS